MAKRYVYFNILKAINDTSENQKKVANILGISDVNFRSKLSGKNQWTINEIETLCKHFNKDYYELFKKDED